MKNHGETKETIQTENEELTATYERVGINQEDLNTSYAMLSRTKDEKSKPMQPKIDEIEGG